MVNIKKIIPFPFQFHFSGAGRDKQETIDIPLEGTDWDERYELRNVFLRSGFANKSNGDYRLLPCAAGTFVRSSDSLPTCKKCPAGKIQYSIPQLRERPMYMNMNMGWECDDRC